MLAKDVCDLLTLLFLPVLNLVLSVERFVYLRLIVGILSFCISAHLTVLPLLNTVLNLTFYPRDAMLARVIAIATCLSVCPSVCHAPVLCQNEER